MKQTSNKKEIFIKADLIFEGNSDDHNLRVMLPRDQTLFLRQGLEMVLTNVESKLRIEIRCKFKESVGDRCFKAFEKCLQDNETINIGSVPDPKIQSFVNQNIKNWSQPSRKVFGILRWFYNSFLNESAAHQEFGWSLDGKEFQKFTTVQISDQMHELLVIDPDPNTFRAIIDDPNKREPDYFRILREAESNIEENPKSALILMVVALEVSLKRLIIETKPEMEKIFNGSSPPSLENTFITLLPELHPSLEFTEESREVFRNLVINRNELVHQGKYNLSKSSLQKRFNFISDILYIFDFQRGMTLFNHAFYEFEPRLVINHKVDNNLPSEFGETILSPVGQITCAAKQMIRFLKRPWQI